MYMPNNPERSYWEAMWNFPVTQSLVSVTLPGNERGPYSESREFYLRLSERFDDVIDHVRPKIEKVCLDWQLSPLPDDLFSAVKLSGFNLQYPMRDSMRWEVSFETLGSKWLGITIPFVGSEPQSAIIDT